MANVGVNNDKLINFSSHEIDNNYEVFKFYENDTQLGEWLEVKYLKVGDEIAVPDNSTNTIKWERIASINVLEPQHVYDLSIEGTRNFIANDIVAHNTYLATSSGNVGINTTTPARTLTVQGTLNVSNPGTSGQLILDSSGNVGIGTTTPNATLDVRGTGIFSTGFVNFTNNTAFNQTLYLVNGNVGIGTTGPQQPLHIVESGNPHPDPSLLITTGSGDGYIKINSTGTGEQYIAFASSDTGKLGWMVGKDEHEN